MEIPLEAAVKLEQKSSFTYKPSIVKTNVKMNAKKYVETIVIVKFNVELEGNVKMNAQCTEKFGNAQGECKKMQRNMWRRSILRYVRFCTPQKSRVCV